MKYDTDKRIFVQHIYTSQDKMVLPDAVDSLEEQTLYEPPFSMYCNYEENKVSFISKKEPYYKTFNWILKQGFTDFKMPKITVQKELLCTTKIILTTDPKVWFNTMYFSLNHCWGIFTFSGLKTFTNQKNVTHLFSPVEINVCRQQIFPTKENVSRDVFLHAKDVCENIKNVVGEIFEFKENNYEVINKIFIKNVDDTIRVIEQHIDMRSKYNSIVTKSYHVRRDMLEVL